MHSFPPVLPLDPWPFIVVGFQCGVAFMVVSWLLLRRERKVRTYDAVLWLILGLVLSCILLVGTPGSLDTRLSRKVGLIIIWVATLACTLWSGWRLKKRSGEQGVVFSVFQVVVFLVLLANFAPAVAQARDAAWRAACRNNMRDLTAALLAHEEAQDAFLPQAAGSPPRSWRVEILPFLDQSDLAARYDSTLPWTDDANLPVARTRVPGLNCPAVPPYQTNGLVHTAYALPVSEHGIFRTDGSSLRPGQVRDGLNSTILLVEACGQKIVWTEPRDVDVQQAVMAFNAPGARRGESNGVMSSYHSASVNAAFADGSTRALSTKIAPDILNSLLHADDGGPDMDGF